jgi:SAM-dependent methyltransferase
MGGDGRYAGDNEFWARYARGRPSVPQSFWDRLYDWHASHNGHFGTVHDIGGGAGSFVPELAKKFSKVILSDPSSFNVENVKAQLLSRLEEQQLEFIVAKAEDEITPTNGVDIIFSINMLHWTKIDVAMAQIARQLKPGGTFFAGYFGSSTLYNEAAQKVWADIFDRGFRKFAEKVPPEPFQSIAGTGDTGYDAVALDESVFEAGALRLKLNDLGNPKAFLIGPGVPRSFPPPELRIRPFDRYERKHDHEWDYEKAVAGLKDIVATFPLGITEEEYKSEWDEMEAALNGGKVKGSWHASFIYATKKSSL